MILWIHKEGREREKQVEKTERSLLISPHAIDLFTLK